MQKPRNRIDRIWHVLFDLRTRLIVLSAIACLLGLWIICVEGLRFSASDIDLLGGPQNSRISLAAQLGVLRADLWAEDALSLSDWVPEEGLARPLPDDGRLGDALEAAKRSLSFGPLNSNMWLLLAMQSSAGTRNFDNTASLEMAYLTDPWDPKLFPARFAVAGKSQALKSKMIQDFVKSDVEQVATKAPNLRPILLRIYRESSPENRAVLQEIIDSVDPNLLKSLD